MSQKQDPSMDNLQQADQLGLIAHEIKSPIAATIQLLQTAEILLDRPEDDTVRGLIHRAHKRAASALDLTRNLLEYVKVSQSNKPKKRTDKLFPSERLPILLEKHIHKAESLNIRIICEFAGRGTPVNVNEFEFDLIADNLISNALRYSKRDKTAQRIWIRTMHVEGGVSLGVKDEGIGMTTEDKEKIFSGFYRSMQAKEQTISGTGLGMAIVKKIVDDIGATIECNSTPGTGTAFIVTFPFVDDPVK